MANCLDLAQVIAHSSYPSSDCLSQSSDEGSSQLTSQNIATPNEEEAVEQVIGRHSARVSGETTSLQGKEIRGHGQKRRGKHNQSEAQWGCQ